MAKKVVAFSIEIDGKKEIKEVTQLFGLLEKQIKDVNKQLDELNKKTKDLSSKGLKETEKQLEKTGTSAKRLTTFFKTSFTEFDRGNKIVQDLGNGYFEVTRAIDKASAEVKDNADSISDLIKRNKELKKALSDAKQGVESIDFKGQTVEVSKLTKEYSQNNDAIKQFRKELRTGKKETDVQKGSIADLRKRVSELKKEYIQLTPAQQKFTLQGIKTRRELIRLTKRLKAQEEQIGDFRRSVGNYARSLDRVGKAALKVFGIRGAFEGLRRVGQGFTTLIEKGAETNATFGKIQEAVSGLSNSATNLGTNILETFGAGIQRTIESVSFVIFKVSEAFTSLANSGGLVGNVLSFIGTIITDFPSVLGGVREVFNEFFARIGRGFENASLRAERLFLNVKRATAALTGADVDAIDKNLERISERLNQNAQAAVSFSEAYTRGFEAVSAEQDAFTKRNLEEAEAIAKAEKAREAANAAREKAQAEEKQRLEQLANDRQKFREELINEEVARLQIIKQLGEQIIDAQIENEQDATKAAIEAENVRFRRQQEARNANFEKLKADVEAQRAEFIRLELEGTDEFKAFEEKAGRELRQVKALNNQLEAEQTKAHQNNLTAITENATKERLEKEKKAAEERAKIAISSFSNVSNIFKKGVANISDVVKKGQEERRAELEATKEALITAANTLLDGISQIAQLAADAENQRFEDSINERQANIEQLNEDLSNATGLQKKFLEQQIEQEERALEAQTAAAERARKEQAATQKAIAIVQAIISTAVAVTQALGSSPPPASFILAAAAGAAGAVQIATIAAQKFALGGIAQEGGVINGPSHSEGGVPFTIAGKSGFEAEGGEAIINKRSTSLFKPLLSRINQAGGGKAFQTGGITPISAPVVANQTQSNFNEVLQAFNTQTEAINNRIDRIQVINSIDDFNEVNDQETALNAESTL